MISTQALHQLLDHTCRTAAALAALRMPEYDLPRVQRYLDLMAQENLAGWRTGEVIATIEARTRAGCPDPDDPEAVGIMQQCFADAVQETIATNE